MCANFQTFPSAILSKHLCSVSSLQSRFSSVLWQTKAFTDSSPSTDRVKLNMPEPNWFPSQRRPRGPPSETGGWEPEAPLPAPAAPCSWIWALVLDEMSFQPVEFLSQFAVTASLVLIELMSGSEGVPTPCGVHTHYMPLCHAGVQTGFPLGLASLPGCSWVFRSCSEGHQSVDKEGWGRSNKYPQVTKCSVEFFPFYYWGKG